MVDLIPATIVYRDYGLPRALLRQLAVQGIVKCEVRLAPDKTNQMFFYSRADIERYLGGSAETTEK